MAKSPPPKPTTWTVQKIASKQIRLFTREAADERKAIQKAAEEFKQPAPRRLIGLHTVAVGIKHEAFDLQPGL